MSEFKEKSGLINELLKRSDLDFEPKMTKEEREALDIERQMLVLRAGWNNMSVLELRELLEPKPAKKEVKRKKEIHPIFQYLWDLIRGKIWYYCLSSDDKINIVINNYLTPIRTNVDIKKYTPWIHVTIESYGGRIHKLEEEFTFSYPKDGKWRVQLDGNIRVTSALTHVHHTFWERDKSVFAGDNVDYEWLMLQLDALLELIKNAHQYDPYSNYISSRWHPLD
jgi:hypothetical protein